MKEFLKQILKKAGLYYFVQGHYRDAINTLKKKYNRIAYKKFKGQGFICNNCGSSYTKFVPGYPHLQDKEAITKNNVIAGYGKNIYCPYCMCSARNRLVLAVLQHRLDVKGKRVLHLSPEKFIFRHIIKIANLTTGDIEPGFYRSIDKNTRQLDLTSLTFKDDTFDVVIGNHIMEHIPEDKKAMAEIYRVLKPQGVAVLQVPYSSTIPFTLEEPYINDPERQSELFGQKDHVRIYEFNNYLERLSAAGFATQVLKENDLEAFTKYAIQPGENVILAYKY